MPSSNRHVADMENEATLRLGVFLGLFTLFGILEFLFPRRARVQSQLRRWSTNWILLVIYSVVIRLMGLLAPVIVATGAAQHAAANGWGLFYMVDLPLWLEFTLAIIILDWAVWFQHLVTHKIPFLWRFHRVHHSDRDLDVSSAIRFHPVEIALSMLYKVALVYLLGAPVLAVIIFEVILNGAAMFNHANINLPKSLDRIIRTVIVTPDMHRIHHSDIRTEHDSNYGFSVSIWDHIFRTFTAEPKGGHKEMTVGLRWQDDKTQELVWALKLPADKL